MLKTGDIVYLKSDLKLKHPMTVIKSDPDNDIVVNWLNSQGKREVAFYDSVDVFIIAQEVPEVTYIPNIKK